MSSGSGRAQSRREFLQMLGAPGQHCRSLESSRTSAGGRLAPLQLCLPTSPSQAGLAHAANISGSPTNKQFLLEEMGCGVALFDYDNDGWLDIFLVNGTSLDPAVRDRNPTSYLFHNNRDGTFTDVTEKARLNSLRLGTRLLRRRLRQRWLRRSVRHLFGTQRSLPQQWRRHFHRRIRAGWRCGIRKPLGCRLLFSGL